MIRGDSDKAGQFLADNWNLAFSEHTPGVSVEIIGRGNHLRVVLGLTEDTTSNQIKKAIPTALEWRNRLMEWQGIWEHGGDNSFLIQLDRRHKKGGDYAELAEEINERIAKYLKRYAKFVEEFKTAFPKLTATSRDYDDWLFAEFRANYPNEIEDIPGEGDNRLSNSMALDKARNVLKAIRYQADETPPGAKKKRRRQNEERPKDIDAILANGLEGIEKGKPPFDKGYPVDAERVEATLKSWRNGKKNKIRERVHKREQAESGDP